MIVYDQLVGTIPCQQKLTGYIETAINQLYGKLPRYEEHLSDW